MHVVARLTKFFTQLISETSGLSLDDTLALAEHAPQLASDEVLATEVPSFVRSSASFVSMRRRSRRCSVTRLRARSRSSFAASRFRFAMNTFT